MLPVNIDLAVESHSLLKGRTYNPGRLGVACFAEETRIRRHDDLVNMKLLVMAANDEIGELLVGVVGPGVVAKFHRITVRHFEQRAGSDQERGNERERGMSVVGEQVTSNV